MMINGMTITKKADVKQGITALKLNKVISHTVTSGNKCGVFLKH